jgi:hypothetical protein
MPQEALVASSNKLLEHYVELHAQMLDDIAACRSGGWRLVRSNEDMTETWLRNQQARAEKLDSLIEAHEKLPIYIYGAF